MPTAYVLLNSDLGSDSSIINEVKQVLQDEDVKFEVQGVYGVYDIVLKLSSDNAENLRAIITYQIFLNLLDACHLEKVSILHYHFLSPLQ